MPSTDSLIAMSAQDEDLRLSGSAGNPFETVTATGNGDAKYYGSNTTVRQRLVVAGAVTGTNPTLDVKFQDSVDGVTFVDMGYAFAQVTASQNTVVGNLSAFPVLTLVTQNGRPWVRIVKTIGGSATPTFNSVAVLHEPSHGGF